MILNFEGPIKRAIEHFENPDRKAKLSVLEVHGFTSAMIGLSLNKSQPLVKMSGVAKKLANLDQGHNKFLESIICWCLVTAPRYAWQDFDTYRLSTKQSQSTNHTIMQNSVITSERFVGKSVSDSTLSELNELLEKGDFITLKRRLPEGFLQTREWCFSLKTARNIIIQRWDHKVLEVGELTHQLYDELKEYQDFLPRM